MLKKILDKLFRKTSIHGSDQISDSILPCQITWIGVILLLAGFSIYQIVGLTRTYVHGDTTFANHNYDISSWDDLDKHLRILYCAPDWMNEKMMMENNASALSLFIALSDIVDSLHPLTYRLLYDLLTAEESRLVSYEPALIDDYAYGSLGWIRINLTIEQSQDALGRELIMQNVSSGSDLVKKFINAECQAPEIAVRYGMVCQIMKKSRCDRYGWDTPMYFEDKSVLDKDKHDLDYDRIGISDFMLFVEPVEIDYHISHQIVNKFAFFSKMNTNNKVNSSYDSVNVLYESVMTVTKTTFLSTKERKCTSRKHAIFKKEKLGNACMAACQYSLAIDYSKIDDVDAFLNDATFPSMTLFRDSTKPELSFLKLREDDITKCQENCEEMQRSCEELEVRIRPMTEVIMDTFDRNDSFIVRYKSFAITMESFQISEELKILTFDSYVGAVGGSLGVALGASLVSILQFGINFFTLFLYSRTDKMENEGSVKASIC